MSAFYREQINNLFIPATKIVENQKTFPVPIKCLTQTTTQFHDCIRSIIGDLDIEKQNATFLLDNLSLSHSQWMALRTSMTENERLNDSRIFDEFLQKTPYLKIINEIKRYSRKLRCYRNNLENSLPKNCLQFDHSDLLPELNLAPDCITTLKSPPNQPFKENLQSPLPAPYNSGNHFYSNQTHTQINLSPNPLNQENLPSTQNSNILRNEFNNFYGSQILNHQSSNNNYKEISFGPPPGFDSFEKIPIIDKSKPDDIKNPNCEELIPLPELINENCDNKQHINSEESQHNLNDNPPPGFPPLEEICIITDKNSSDDFKDSIWEEQIQLPEIINEEYEDEQHTYLEESPTDLINNSPPSLHDSQSNNLETPIPYETNYIPKSEYLMKESTIITTAPNYQEFFYVKSRKDNIPRLRKKQKIELPKQICREPTIINPSRPNITTPQIRPKRIKVVHPIKLKHCNTPTKNNVHLNCLKHTHKENPSSQLPPLKATRINKRRNLTIKKLSTTLSNIKLFELQFILHEVINWKEILSMIDKQDFTAEHQTTANKIGKIKCKYIESNSLNFTLFLIPHICSSQEYECAFSPRICF
ncbi:unnamed protein product [Meloidogyne enterolobii]|uniref:Uncharacterized protein n=1 Tax=Meloidogyne enterolobii TaxID=390850 RepID=A0ACB0ZQY2_MELEN